MATITIIQDLKSGSSDLVSAHNFNMLLFRYYPDDDTNTITAQISISIAGVTTYFDAYLYDVDNIGGTEDSSFFKIDISEIIKYGIIDFYYKAVSSGLNVSTLVTSLTITFYGAENGTVNDTDTLTLYFSHGINQIGYDYGSNMMYLYNADDLSFTAFANYPFEAYLFNNASRAIETNLIDLNGKVQTEMIFSGTRSKNLLSIKDTLTNPGLFNLLLYTKVSNLITTWSHSGFNTFTFSGSDITSAIKSTAAGTQYCYTNLIAVTAGQTYYLFVNININSGSYPVLKIDATTDIIYSYTDNESYIFIFRPTVSESIRVNMTVGSGLVTNFSATFSMYNISWEQFINLTVKDSCDSGVYIRYLSKEGFYRYWLFEAYKKVTRSGNEIGELIPAMTTMTAAQYRTRSIGYEDVYESIDVLSHNVTTEQQEQLMDIFTSPAVYMWLGEAGTASAEADWILVKVTGNHEVNYKNKFQNFSCRLRLPESYTQRR